MGEGYIGPLSTMFCYLLCSIIISIVVYANCSTVIISKFKKILGSIFEKPIINIPSLTLQPSPSRVWMNFSFNSTPNPTFPVKISEDKQNAWESHCFPPSNSAQEIPRH